MLRENTEGTDPSCFYSQVNDGHGALLEAEAVYIRMRMIHIYIYIHIHIRSGLRSPRREAKPTKKKSESFSGARGEPDESGCAESEERRAGLPARA